jgi:hypothetical protein
VKLMRNVLLFAPVDQSRYQRSLEGVSTLG